jgi:hypothetical protein
MNTAGQPKRPISMLAANPPSAPPMEKPQTTVVTRVARSRVGAYSETRAMPAGMAPPSAMPVKKRIHVRPCRSVTREVAAISAP